jgi:hypothetical protein
MPALYTVKFLRRVFLGERSTTLFIDQSVSVDRGPTRGGLKICTGPTFGNTITNSCARG